MTALSYFLGLIVHKTSEKCLTYFSIKVKQLLFSTDVTKPLILHFPLKHLASFWYGMPTFQIRYNPLLHSIFSFTQKYGDFMLTLKKKSAFPINSAKRACCACDTNTEWGISECNFLSLHHEYHHFLFNKNVQNNSYYRNHIRPSYVSEEFLDIKPSQSVFGNLQGSALMFTSTE